MSEDLRPSAEEIVRRLRAEEKPVILDLGSAGRRRGTIAVDRVAYDGVDLVCDVTRGIPLPDNSADGVVMFHLVEHLKNEEVEQLLYEAWRVCRPGAIVHVRTPHFSCGDIAWSDPTHVRPYGVRSFSEYFCASTRGHFNSRYPRLPAYEAVAVTLHYYAFREDRRVRLRLFGDLVDRLVNVTPWIQRQFERRLAYLLGGFEEVEAKMRVLK